MNCVKIKEPQNLGVLLIFPFSTGKFLFCAENVFFFSAPFYLKKKRFAKTAVFLKRDSRTR
jgi:hypothetical protein